MGFYLGRHDSNVAALIGGRVRYRKFERLSGIKHDHVGLEALALTCAEWGVTPDYVAFSDGGRNGLGSCAVEELWRLSPALKGLEPRAETFCLDHHYAHALSAMAPEDGAGTVAFGLDGRGDNGVRARVMRFDGALEAETLIASPDFMLGRFFNALGQRLGLAGQVIDFAGKIMGAQAYGEPDPGFVAALAEDDPVALPRRLLKEIPWRGRRIGDDADFFDIASQDFLGWLASAHEALRQCVMRFFGQYAAPESRIVYAGGCAQNTVFNASLYDVYSDLTIPPHSYDGGLSLGCLEFLIRKLGLPPADLGPFPFIQDDEDCGEASAATAARMAELLAAGRIVGWVQDHGEIGPRALGHRSILMDPRSPDGKATLNARVKGREPWRPYAASVLAEAAADWFDAPRPSPYMLAAVPTRADKLDAIPAVVHRDGTCRIQTVDRDAPGAGPYHALIAAFGELTGTPLVLNTSLNAGGEPIHGRAGQALPLLRDGRLDALCVGDRILFPEDV